MRVDLPTFGRPTKHAKPDLKGYGGAPGDGAGSPAGEDGVCGDPTP
jgi:hypothetical protein